MDAVRVKDGLGNGQSWLRKGLGLGFRYGLGLGYKD
jgi:hypothetical protein